MKPSFFPVDSTLYVSPVEINKLNLVRNSFSVINMNIRSLNRNFDKIVYLVKEFSFKIDVIGVSETWLREGNRLLHSMPGYSFVSKPSSSRSGGTGFFVREDLKYNIYNDLDIEIKDCEYLFINVELSKNQNILVGTFYRHCDINFSSFEKGFLEIINIFNNKNLNYLIGGDFNIDLTKTSMKHVDYIENLLSYGCNQKIKEPTRFCKNDSPSLLDHIYTNLTDSILQNCLIQRDVSDHLPILSICTYKAANKPPRTIFQRDFSSFDLEKFLIDMENSNKLLLDDSNLDANRLCTKFCKDYERLVNLHAPIKPISLKKQRLIQKPWMNKNIIKMVKHKNKLFRIWLKQQSDATYEIYKKKRNETTRAIELAKRAYYNRLFFNAKSDPKKLWKNVNRMINYKSYNKSNIQDIDDGDGNIITDRTEISNTFNDFFVKIGEDLAKKIPQASDDTMANLLRTHKNSLFFSPITPTEVKRLLQQLDTTKSTPSSHASYWFLKSSAQCNCAVIALLFNKCIEEGVFPSVFKIAEVIPIFKSGNRKLVTNYRPISLLHPLSKLFEKCIHSRLDKFLTKNQLLYNNQFGFRSNSSTEHAVTRIFNQISQNVDENKVVCTVFLDLKKAFDTVNHAILLKKLHKYGVRGNALRLFKDFISDRWQYTVVGGLKSDLKAVKCGVPQGSTLGPLLFLIYINDFHLATNFELNLFADDSCLFLCNSSAKELELQTNKELSRVKLWLQLNQLSLNIKKSTFLVFSKKAIPKFELKIGNETLMESTQTTYLGITVDNKLKWDLHINKVKSKIASACWAMSKIKHYVNSDVLKKIYFGLIYPHLSYCVTCWGATTRVEEIFILQKRAIRIVGHRPYLSHTSPIFKEHRLLKLTDIYKLKMGIMMFKITNGSWFGNTNYTKTSTSHNYNTRYAKADNFVLPQIWTNIGKHSAHYMGPHSWAQIPISIKNLPFYVFKKKLTDFFILSY